MQLKVKHMKINKLMQSYWEQTGYYYCVTINDLWLYCQHSDNAIKSITRALLGIIKN